MVEVLATFAVVSGRVVLAVALSVYHVLDHFRSLHSCGVGDDTWSYFILRHCCVNVEMSIGKLLHEQLQNLNKIAV